MTSFIPSYNSLNDNITLVIKKVIITLLPWDQCGLVLNSDIMINVKHTHRDKQF